MSDQINGTAPDSGQQDAMDIVAEADTGARSPSGIPKKILWAVPLAWAGFQLWLASPLPFMLRFGIFTSTEARSIHLAFAIFLAFLAFPALKRSPRSYIPIQDWIVALVAAFCASDPATPIFLINWQDCTARLGTMWKPPTFAVNAWKWSLPTRWPCSGSVGR